VLSPLEQWIEALAEKRTPDAGGTAGKDVKRHSSDA
jgi:hypothetical protein